MAGLQALKGVGQRLLIPAGLTGTIVLLVPCAVFFGLWIYYAYPFLLLLIAYCSIRNVVLAKEDGAAALFAIIAGLGLTGLAAVLALSFVVASGGV